MIALLNKKAENDKKKTYLHPVVGFPSIENVTEQKRIIELGLGDPRTIILYLEVATAYKASLYCRPMNGYHNHQLCIFQTIKRYYFKFIDKVKTALRTEYMN